MAKGRKTGGRRKGTPNKGTAEVKAYAQQFSIEAVNLLMEIARNRKADTKARVLALREVLDRGHGKSPVAVTGADGGPLEIPAAIQFVITKADGADSRR